MTDHERKFATPSTASPDVTIKVTDAQLNHSSAQAKEYLGVLRNHEASIEEDELADTRSSLSTTSFGGLMSALKRSILPDFSDDREKTEVTRLLDSTRSEINITGNGELSIGTTGDEELPPLQSCYEPGEAFAEGGQGVISRGRDKTLRRTIAIKSLRKELLDKPSLRKAFLAEALVTAQLEHPAIVPIYGLFSDGERGIHQTMKLVKGHTLHEELRQFITQWRSGDRALRRPGVFAQLVNRRIELLLKVCEAVAYAHSRNIIHCDLKPENIMIGEYGEVYVMDWGLARHFHDRNGRPLPLPKEATLDGTPRYMPHEAFEGHPRDERTDIFALGLILFEMVTLRHGFTGKNIPDVIRKIKDDERNPVVNRFGFHLDRDLVAIVEKATAYHVDLRYQHVNEFSNDLRRYLEGEAVSARPETFGGRIYRWCRRHTNTLVLLLLSSWVIFGIIGTHHLKMLMRQQAADLVVEREAGEVARMNIRQLEFEQHLAMMDSRVIRSAIRLSNTLVELAGDLRNVSQVAGQLLGTDMAAPVADTQSQEAGVEWLPIINCHEITPKTGTFSPVYNDYIKPHACSYQIPPGRDHALTMSEVQHLAPIGHHLQNLVVNSKESLRGSGPDELERALVTDGVLIRRAYLGVHDTGLHIAFPGSGSYTDDYDNHNRTWYQDAYRQAQESVILRPIWGKPYQDISNKQQVLTCSIPVFDRKHVFRGVAAFDLFFETFADQLRMDGNGTGEEIVEKFLCTGDGRILCHVVLHPISSSASSEEVEELFRHQLSFLFQRKKERMTGGYGHFKTQEHGHFIYYHYAYIPGLNFYLIEKSSEEAIMEEIEKEALTTKESAADVFEAVTPADPPPEEAVLQKLEPPAPEP